MVKFGCEPDIFSVSATLYTLATKKYPQAILYNSNIENILRKNLEAKDLSEGFINAIIAGLQAAAQLRPKNAQAFLNLFPGCENMKL